MILPSNIPKNMIIELTNRCNLECPVCTTHLDMRRPRGMMKDIDYYDIVDRLKFGDVRKLIYNFAGEPLLHPQVGEFINYACVRGFETSVCTNGTKWRRLPSGLRTLTVCLDGADCNSHEYYRRGSDFVHTKDNIRRWREELKTTKIIIQTLLTSRSEHQVNQMIKLAGDLEVNKIVFKRMHSGHSSDRLDLLPCDKTMRRARKWRPVCKATMNAGLIYWNGDLGICCADFNGMAKMPNIFDDFSVDYLFRRMDVIWKRQRAVLKRYEECKRCELSGAGGIRWKEVIFG